ncbi:signal peptide peptidase SppA [Flavobacterium sp.]|uniref:signal peptide peptidase SppA n=1 Tax=Flavobacterium sp. TaxID=239 RepID=UPI0026268B45|nr:signal peptide peptidase SppA [Flavobacterium sp.]MDD3004202.1 signal peptide peptidase SppA [Flavobacterium sp.]
MKFLGNVLATIVGLFVFIMIFIFGIIFIGVLFGGNAETVKTENNSVIELNLENIGNDYIGKYSDPMITLFQGNNTVGLTDVIEAIDAAKTDENIKGISILNNYSNLGIAQIKSLRDALNDFKKSGKFIVSYADSYSQKDYYLNSVADTIYLNPLGEMDFKGLSSEIMFYKSLQEKTGVKMEVIRHGKYKSAVEPYIADEMSEANREQITALLNSIWNGIVTDIAKSRKISVNQLNTIADGLLARTPEMAKSAKLIDKIAYEDQFHAAIKKALKVEKDKDYKKISISDYTLHYNTKPKNFDADESIAVIYAQGEIRSGEGDVSYIGEKSMNRALKEARENKKIKAVVLRIDSPGGSALTSELIWREIELTKKVKPVIVSMGNLAASGGYYIACNADKIFAENATITGSIGVFGMLPNFSTLTEKIGIHTEQVSTHKNAANYSPFVPLTEDYRSFTQESIERIYKTFVNRVATGRKMTFEQVDEIVQGRVWTGAEALKIGLVDEIGGLDKALAEAAKRANLKDYKTTNFPEFEKSLSDMFGQMYLSQTKEELLEEEIGTENYKVWKQFKDVAARKGIQTVLPYELIIK